MPVHDHRGRAITACNVIELHIYKGDNEFLYESGNHEVCPSAIYFANQVTTNDFQHHMFIIVESDWCSTHYRALQKKKRSFWQAQ